MCSCLFTRCSASFPHSDIWVRVMFDIQLVVPFSILYILQYFQFLPLTLPGIPIFPIPIFFFFGLFPVLVALFCWPFPHPHICNTVVKCKSFLFVTHMVSLAASLSFPDIVIFTEFDDIKNCLIFINLY